MIIIVMATQILAKQKFNMKRKQYIISSLVTIWIFYLHRYTYNTEEAQTLRYILKLSFVLIAITAVATIDNTDITDRKHCCHIWTRYISHHACTTAETCLQDSLESLKRPFHIFFWNLGYIFIIYISTPPKHTNINWIDIIFIILLYI